MPVRKGRPRKGPHLYLKRRERFGRQSVWIIRDGAIEKSTGCCEGELGAAERALQAYLGAKYTTPKAADRLEAIAVADVMRAYLAEHAPRVKRPDFIKSTAAPILDWWGTKTLADIRGKTCRDYADWRTAQGVRDQTARHDLKTLRAAINYYHREYGPLPAIPALTLPEKAEPRERWITRDQAALMIRLARRGRYTRFLARFILIGVYTGTRPGATLRLKWLPSPNSGWFDLDNGVLYRRGPEEAVTNKRRKPARIPERLMPHLKRWRAMDMAGHAGGKRMWANGKRPRPRPPIINVIHYYGKPVNKLRRSWAGIRIEAKLGKDITPHALRHTAATWLMQAGVDAFEAGGFLSMSVETLLAVYGHHHPDFQEQAARANFKRTKRAAGLDSTGTGPEKDPVNTDTKGEAPAVTANQVLQFKGKTG
jgi:integrase